MTDDQSISLKDRLARLRELSEELNARSDEIAEAVRRLEAFLRHECGLTITVVSAPLIYRSGRLHVVRDGVEELWANCNRDTKFTSFAAVPALIAECVRVVESTIQGAQTARVTLERLRILTG